MVATPASAQTLSSAQIAQIQAQIASLIAQLQVLKGQVASTCGFTRDLTIGSQGADVTCLQKYLTSTGHYTFAGGATGYFGNVTQTAVARWQAANGVSPATGYFGMLSRAKYAMMKPVTPAPTPDTDDEDDDLSGDDAEISGYELNAEEANGEQGENEVAVATAEFDVDGGDARIQSVTVSVEATDSDLNVQPWNYFDRVSIWVDGDEIGDMDVDTRDDWENTDDDMYEVKISGLNEIVREDSRGEVTIAFDIADDIESDNLDQRVRIAIPDEGIELEDSENNTSYVGDDREQVTFGFDSNGNSSNGNSPDSISTSATVVTPGGDASASYATYVIRFEMEAIGDDTYIASTVENSGTAGVTYDIGGDAFSGSESAVLSSTADEDNDFFHIREGDSETFTLTITLNPNASGNYYVELDTIRFNDEESTSGSTEFSPSNDEFRTDTVFIPN